MKTNSNFQNDLELGQIAEFKLVTMLEKLGFKCEWQVGDVIFSGYDIRATKNGKEYWIEVKYDVMEAKTGNTAVELFKTIKGKQEPSGLSITEANVIAYKFLGDDNFYLIQTELLQEKIKSCRTIVQGGDGNRVTLALFPSAVFKSWCRKFTGKKKFIGLGF